jgi:hypothetical protein
MLRRQRPQIDLVTVTEANLNACSDPDLLEWAAERQRVVLSHDVQTLVGFAYDRTARGLPMAGLIVVSDPFSVGRAVEDLLIVIECSLPGEIEGHVRYVPL